MKGENLEEKPRILTGCDAYPSYEFFRYGDTHLGNFRSVSAKDHRDFPLRKPMRHHGNSSIGARTTTFHTLCQPQTPAASHRNFSDLSLTTITSCTSNYSILHNLHCYRFSSYHVPISFEGPSGSVVFPCLPHHNQAQDERQIFRRYFYFVWSGTLRTTRPSPSLVPKWEVSRHLE